MRFLACGVFDPINDYFNKLDLKNSRDAVLKALRIISTHAESQLTCVTTPGQELGLGPFICLKNLDMQEKFCMVSLGCHNSMFYGTWG